MVSEFIMHIIQISKDNFDLIELAVRAGFLQKWENVKI